MKERKITTKQLCIIGLLMALVIVLTAVTKLPIPGASGSYVHLGDMAIFLAAVLLGPAGGAAVGGIGSAIADILAGAPQFAIPTLLVKGCMGLTAGLVATRQGRLLCWRNLLAMVCGALVMVGGYYITYAFMYYGGNFIGPAATIWMDFAQAGTGVALSVILLPAIDRVKDKLLG